jgi:hypothetical protein
MGIASLHPSYRPVNHPTEYRAMNFDFSDDQKQLRDQARKFLGEKCPPKAVRVVLDGKAISSSA